MSQQGTGSVVDFDLPDEILSVIPTDPYQQLDLARKITSMAIASRVSSLESDASRLRQKLLEKDRIILDLEDRLSSLTRASHQTDSTLNTALNENVPNCSYKILFIDSLLDFFSLPLIFSFFTFTSIFSSYSIIGIDSQLLVGD